MVNRPIFIPNFNGPSLCQEQLIEFNWSSGFAEVQKKKNIKALHKAAIEKGHTKILEISTKSDEEVGKKLSAFNLKYRIDGKVFPLESVYQGSKVFKECGPFPEIFEYEPREAKKFIKKKSPDGRNIIKYSLRGKSYPLSPPNAFYDWLYIRSLIDDAEWIEDNLKFDAFTDIEFNPKKQINCQARAFAGYLSLLKSNNLSKASSNFDYFSSMLSAI